MQPARASYVNGEEGREESRKKGTGFSSRTLHIMCPPRGLEKDEEKC